MGGFPKPTEEMLIADFYKELIVIFCELCFYENSYYYNYDYELTATLCVVAGGGCCDNITPIRSHTA